MASDEVTREQLIELCENGIVPEDVWTNRDTAGAQAQLGHAWAWLKAGCDFKVADSPESDERTWWITIWAEGFAAFDWGGGKDEELFYIPTDKRLLEAGGGDWY